MGKGFAFGVAALGICVLGEAPAEAAAVTPKDGGAELVIDAKAKGEVYTAPCVSK